MNSKKRRNAPYDVFYTNNPSLTTQGHQSRSAGNGLCGYFLIKKTRKRVAE